MLAKILAFCSQRAAFQPVNEYHDIFHKISLKIFVFEANSHCGDYGIMLSDRARGDLICMAVVLPFKAVRPNRLYVAKIASLPYDVMTREEGKSAVAGNPLSFLHVEKSEIDVPDKTKSDDSIIYEKAKQNFIKLKKDNVLTKDIKPCFYVYRQRMGNQEQTGLVGLVSAAEYEAGKIRKHELTRKDKEEDRIRHIDTVNAQTGPVFIAYRSQEALNRIIEDIKNDAPEYDFITEDSVSHTVWVVPDEKKIGEIEKLFLSVSVLYIADGHHRAAAATKVARSRRKKDSNSPQEYREYNFIMAVLFPSNQLKIMDYNRAVKDLNKLDRDKYLNIISDKFIVECDFREKSPQKMHEFGMYLKDSWYKLTPRKDSFDEDDPIDSLDASILQKNLLGPVLGIIDPRTDDRIKFIGGIRGMGELEKLVHGGEYAVAFSLYPASMEQIMNVADAGKIMPPKSTWFEPKLRSGIFVHELD